MEQIRDLCEVEFWEVFVYKELGFLSGYPFKVNFPLTDCQIANLVSGLFWPELVYCCYYLLKICPRVISHSWRFLRLLISSIALHRRLLHPFLSQHSLSDAVRA